MLSGEFCELVDHTAESLPPLESPVPRIDDPFSVLFPCPPT